MAVKVDLSEDGQRINLRADFRFKELCKTVPGLKWHNKESIWSMPLSWSGCLALRSTFRSDLDIGPKLTTWAINERTTRIDPSMALRDVIHLEEGDTDLYSYQRAGVAFLATARRALLADEPGTGKTVTSIRALKKLQDAGETVFPLLVVCPNTLKLNWLREFEKWWPEINVQVIHGTATQRRKQFKPFLEPSEDEPMPQVIISNWEGLRGHSRLAPSGSIALVRCVECGGADDSVSLNRCEVHLRELNMIDFKSVIADEIHRSKQPKAKQTRALWAATGDADIRFALTGTPIASDVVDLWSILHWLDPNEWPSKTRWIDRMVNTMMNAFGGLVVIGIKPTMKDEFFAALHPRMRRMLKAVVLPQLPPVVLTRRDVEMSPKQRTAYNQMRDKMIAEIEGEYLSATTPLTQTIRLIQFASAYAEVEVNEDTGETKTILTEPSAKIDSLMDDISSGDFGDSSVAVSAVSRQLIDLLSARLTKAKIPHGLITGTCSAEDRQKAVDDFQNGRIKWILFTAQAGGVGITLTAAKYLVRLQRPWSLVDDKQVNDRVHRIGSEIHDSVIILDYVTAGTIEERVAEVLSEKGENFEEVVKDKEKLLAALKGTKVF
jgi:SNF2 family DNA or RNA helicase